jgi:hypothetical protein
MKLSRLECLGLWEYSLLVSGLLWFKGSNRRFRNMLAEVLGGPESERARQRVRVVFCILPAVATFRWSGFVDT